MKYLGEAIAIILLLAAVLFIADPGRLGESAGKFVTAFSAQK